MGSEDWISYQISHFFCIKDKSILSPCYVRWVNLNRKNSMSFVPSVANSYALTQPQRRRGTETITAAGPDSHNSAKSH